MKAMIGRRIATRAFGGSSGRPTVDGGTADGGRLACGTPRRVAEQACSVVTEPGICPQTASEGGHGDAVADPAAGS
jgi:hypothetical protein